MTYTCEAKDIADEVKRSGKVLQVGSQYTSLDHFHKAKKAIEDGLIGEVVWASGGFGRNSTARGNEWNYKIDPEANESNLDWKAFIGSAPKRAFDPARYFRWRKYWDYSGGIATDLFYHTVSPLLMTIGPEFPIRVSASGGIYVQKDREVPDTFFMNVDYPQWTMQLACSVTSGVGAPLVSTARRRPSSSRRTARRSQHEMESCPIATTRTTSSRRPARDAVKIDGASRSCAASIRTWTTSSIACAAGNRRTGRRHRYRRWRPSAWGSARIAGAKCCSSMSNRERVTETPVAQASSLQPRR
jgi:hypothetical protein